MEILICAVALHFIGRALKAMKFIKDNLIPEILAALGIAGFFAYYAIIGDINWDTIISSGIISAGMSVYLHQTLKQLIDLLPLNESTKKLLIGAVSKNDTKES